MKTPVLFIVFNRPDLTEKVFQRLAAAKPEQLFLVSDGPREGKKEDEKSCAEVKRILEKITWDCEVHRNYSDKNLGCGIRVASGISWVFEHVDRAIILEDDCLPDPSFFPFCDELLEKYKDDSRVMTVSGRNLQGNRLGVQHSYYYSVYPGTWGWATWRRAWKMYDYHLQLWEGLKETDFPLRITGDEKTATYMRHHFERTYRSDPPKDIQESDYTYTWDYQWVFNCWVQHGLSIIPKKNLISNIGFGKKATHTKDENHEYAALPVSGMEFPLKHPPHKLIDRKADDLHFKMMSKKNNNIQKRTPGIFSRIKNKLTCILRDEN
ncbi:glycosyltransferase family 2 protein [Rhodohalobacter sp. SW132]|uniref:glycosyltransferase family 2 protein n=1 Tax=Rhodohalobacter sp. SW132 TaxID=2293433 RepID=UPI000E255B48|nr:glycosyltransferase family 2 protein [Rhodohalobacter sp. SW132]REL24195.1 glycosyltransferase family 2 protein [Rhodohalobacter sp. SW132]